MTSPQPSATPHHTTTHHTLDDHITYGSASSANHSPVGFPPMAPAEVERMRIFLAPGVAAMVMVWYGMVWCVLREYGDAGRPMEEGRRQMAQSAIR